MHDLYITGLFYESPTHEVAGTISMPIAEFEIVISAFEWSMN